MKDLQTLENENKKLDTVFELVIEGKKYQWNEQYITRKQLTDLAGLSKDAEIFLAVEEPWKDELITENHKINLGRPDIEHFYVKKELKLTINEESHKWHREFITRKQLIKLGGLDPEDDIYLKIAPPGKDELITDQSRINLAQKGIEHFVSRKVDKIVTLIINGTPKQWDKKEITFKDVIILAYGNYIDRPTMVYTVAYEDGPKQNPEGSLLKGHKVFVKNKMIFHATATDKS